MKISTDYLAGIIDGEGTITLCRKNKNDTWRTPYLSVSSTTPEILTALTEVFGGHICKHKVYKEHHLPSFSWRIAGRKAIALCAQLSEKLLVPEKKRRATLIAQRYLQCTPRNGKYTNKQHTKKIQFENDFFNVSGKGGSRTHTPIRGTRF